MEEKENNSAVNPYQINYSFGGNYGWICPKCGRVYSPFTQMCLYCGGIQENNIIYSTTSQSSNPKTNNK